MHGMSTGKQVVCFGHAVADWSLLDSEAVGGHDSSEVGEWPKILVRLKSVTELHVGADNSRPQPSGIVFELAVRARVTGVSAAAASWCRRQKFSCWYDSCLGDNLT